MDKYSTTRFNKAPVIGGKRTRFDLSHDILTTFNTGEFVPILTEFINPGETADLNYASLTRLETSLHQTMDNAYLEFAFFFTPLRILWVDFEKFEGANDDPWAQLNLYNAPQLKLTAVSAAVSVTPGSLLNHLMLPAGNYGSGQTNPHLSVEALSLRNVFEIYNSWYRDENYDSIVYYSKSSVDLTASNAFLFNGGYIYPASQNLFVNRLRDRFSTLLPAPQKGQEISIGITGNAPIITSAPGTGLWYENSSVNMTTSTSDGVTELIGNNPNGMGAIGFVADMSQVSPVTINQLRLAIVRQAMLERDARAGTRYVEITNSRWDVHTNALELDRPEFLGGKRIPISMMEVLQTSESGTTVLGSDAGHSKTVDKSDGFVKSFTQHGILQGFMYVRTARSYSQGIDRMHFFKDYLDLPDPMLDNVGEIAVKRKEMYSLDTASSAGVDLAEQVAGYQEQYYWLKERINRFSGYFQPGINGTLDSWHYGDDYSTYPLISSSWLKESPNQVDRTIAVSSNASFQWSANVHFEFHVTRKFAKYSIPNTFGFK